MMKHNFAINLAIGSVLVVPAVTLQSGTSDSLADALDKTIEALETMAGVEQRIGDETGTGVVDVVRFTEPAIDLADDPGAPDRMLQGLREEVAKLQVRLDDARREDTLAPMPALDALQIDEPELPLAVGTTGLNDSMRNLLASAPQRTARPIIVQIDPEPAELSTTTEQQARTNTIEVDGYAADAVRLGRALYQKGRYEESLTALGLAPTDQEARYWKARCLEKLNRFGEALDEFGRVASSEEGGHFVDRAREDIEFLRWRMAFEGRTKGSK